MFTMESSEITKTPPAAIHRLTRVYYGQPPVPDALGWSVLVAGALIGSVIGGVAGFGAGVILLPLIAWRLDIRATAPILTVTMLIGNLSRIWLNRAELDRDVTLRFLAGAVPATAAGAMLYAGVTSTSLRLIIGSFLIGAVPLRRLLQSRYVRVRLVHFPIIGAVFGLLSAIVVSTGPILAPFYLSYGLRRSAYIATEAVCALAMHVTRGAVFSRYGLLGRETLLVGLVLGGIMFAGAWIARRLLDRISDRVFLAVVEALLVVMGLQFLLLPG